MAAARLMIVQPLRVDIYRQFVNRFKYKRRWNGSFILETPFRSSSCGARKVSVIVSVGLVFKSSNEWFRKRFHRGVLHFAFLLKLCACIYYPATIARATQCWKGFTAYHLHQGFGTKKVPPKHKDVSVRKIKSHIPRLHIYYGMSRILYIFNH